MAGIKDVILNVYFYIEKIKNDYKLIKFQRKWQLNNLENYTKVGNIFPMEKVSVGKFTYGRLNIYTYYNDQESLIIGNYCSIASSVKFILSGEHNYHRVSTYPFKREVISGEFEALCKGPIIIKDDVWIGEGSIIMSGVTVGQGAIIAAGTIVTKDIPPYAIVGGVPAKIIKYRFNQELIGQLIKLDYSKLDKNFIRTHEEDLYSEISNIDQLHWTW